LNIKAKFKKLCRITLALVVISGVVLLQAIPISAATLYENLNTGDDGASDDIYGSNWSAMVFTADSTSHTITSARVKIKKTGSPGTVILSLKETASSLPTGDDLTSATLNGNNFSTSYDWIEFDFTETGIEGGKEYALVLRATAGDNTNDIQWASDIGGGLSGAVGCNSTNSGITWASDTPEDYLFEVWGEPALDLIDGAVFSGYLEDNDLLFLIHYLNTYEPYYPYNDPSQYFNLQILDTDGSTLLHQVPCEQWGNMPGSVYLKADTAAGLTPGASYYLRIYGTFTGNPSDSYQLSSDEWLGTATAYLDQWVINTAYAMEEYYDLDLTTSVAGQGVALNDVGSVAFMNGVAELANVRPNLFQEVTPEISYADTTLTDAFSAGDTWQNMLGTDAVAVAEDASNILGIEDDQTAIAVFLIMGYIATAVFTFPRGHTTAGFALMFPFIIIAGVTRVAEIQIIGIIAAVALLLTVWSFWWTRT
jgi:hypothetical protein